MNWIFSVSENMTGLLHKWEKLLLFPLKRGEKWDGFTVWRGVRRMEGGSSPKGISDLNLLL